MHVLISVEINFHILYILPHLNLSKFSYEPVWPVIDDMTSANYQQQHSLFLWGDQILASQLAPSGCLGALDSHSVLG